MSMSFGNEPATYYATGGDFCIDLAIDRGFVAPKEFAYMDETWTPLDAPHVIPCGSTNDIYPIGTVRA